MVRLIEGRYASLYDPTRTYVLGQRVKEPARPKHGGGFYSYPSREQATVYLTECLQALPFHPEVATPALALLECEVSGHLISYGDKIASTVLRPLRVLEIREVPQEVPSEESVEEQAERAT